MVTEQLIWAIFFLPLASFAFIALIVRPFFNRYSIVSGPIAILAIGASFVLSILAFIEVAIKKNHHIVNSPYDWLTVGQLKFTVGI